ncbi:MAG: diguanylate cyclase [Sulfurimonas sp.]|nr:diguanylate cyclase [Sulfurimonas sp.]
MIFQDRDALASLRVLYVEDDKNTQEEIAFFLESFVSKLYLASDGEEGYQAYLDYMPDLIITDIQMPKMNGIEMVKKIRETDMQIPIIITTAYNETEYLLNAINTGVDRYLLKPVNFIALSEAIKACHFLDTNKHFHLSIDTQGTILDINDAAARLLGFLPQELKTHSLMEYVDLSFVEKMQNYLENLKKADFTKNFRMILRKKDGTCLESIFCVEEYLDEVINIEIKNIEIYMQNELSLNKSLESERFAKSLTELQYSINLSLDSAINKLDFLQNVVRLFTEIEGFEYAYSACKEADKEIEIVARSTAARSVGLESFPPKCLGMQSPYFCPLLEVINTQKMLVIEDVDAFIACESDGYLALNGIKSMIMLPIGVFVQENKQASITLLLSKVFHLNLEALKQFENISHQIGLGLKLIEERLERNNLQVQLRQERDFTNSVLDTAGIIIVVINREEAIVRFNKTAEQYSGYSAQEVLGKPYFWEHFLLEEERTGVVAHVETLQREPSNAYYENHWIAKNGEKRLFSWLNTSLMNEKGEVEYLIATGHDITERKKNEKLIEHLAFYDPLTQLPNRRLLGDRVLKALAMSNRSGMYGALLFLDLDNFKPLNDTYGHTVGDILLIEAAKRIQDCIRESDTVARFGGDEFVILLSEINKDVAQAYEHTESVASKIRMALEKPYHLEYLSNENEALHIDYQCTSSIGIKLYKGNEFSQDTLIQHADGAMYIAKSKGKNQIHIAE